MANVFGRISSNMYKVQVTGARSVQEPEVNALLDSSYGVLGPSDRSGADGLRLRVNIVGRHIPMVSLSMFSVFSKCCIVG